MDTGMRENRYAAIVVMMLIAVTALAATACSRGGNGSGNPDDKPEMQSSAFRLQEIGDMPSDVLRTERPASHSFAHLEASLYGEYCDHSGKELRSRRYGAVAVSADGSVYRFRSVENLIWHMMEKDLNEDDFRMIGIVDFISAKKLMKPDDLMFHLSRNLPSPGGSWISAMDPDADASLLFNIGEAYPGTRHSWEEVQLFLRERSEQI